MTATTTPTTTVNVPNVNQPSGIDWGDFAAQFLMNVEPIAEKLADAGVTAAATAVPFGTVIESFIGPNVINQYVYQAFHTASAAVAGKTIELPDSQNFIVQAATSMFNAGEPHLAAFLGPKVGALIQSAAALLPPLYTPSAPTGPTG